MFYFKFCILNDFSFNVLIKTNRRCILSKTKSQSTPYEFICVYYYNSSKDPFNYRSCHVLTGNNKTNYYICGSRFNLLKVIVFPLVRKFYSVSKHCVCEVLIFLHNDMLDIIDHFICIDSMWQWLPFRILIDHFGRYQN